MSNSVKVSIITPCFNSEKTIRRTIESVKNQTYDNIEYIIIDGGSSDGTMDIVKEYAAKFPFELKYVSERDGGIYFGMNKGISMASGELTGIVNSDDFYELNAVEEAVKAYQQGEKQIVYGMVRYLNHSMETKVILFGHDNLRKQMICHPACFISKSVYEEIGLYDTTYRSSADYDFMLRAFENREIVFTPVYKIFSNFSEGGTSASVIGSIETAEIWKKNGIINNHEYTKRMMHAKLAQLKRKVLKYFG